jgi:hypothetical protein
MVMSEGPLAVELKEDFQGWDWHAKAINKQRDISWYDFAFVGDVGGVSV